MSDSAMAWSLSLYSIYSSEKLLPYLCMSHGPFECYDNNIQYLMQWVKRGTVDGQRFFTGLSRDRNYRLILEILSTYNWKVVRNKQPFPGRQRPPSCHWCMDSQCAASPVMVLLSSSNCSSAHAGFPLHTIFFSLVIPSDTSFKDKTHIFPWLREL